MSVCRLCESLLLFPVLSSKGIETSVVVFFMRSISFPLKSPSVFPLRPKYLLLCMV